MNNLFRVSVAIAAIFLGIRFGNDIYAKVFQKPLL